MVSTVLKCPGMSWNFGNVLDFLVFLEIVLNCPEILLFTTFQRKKFFVFLLFLYAEQPVDTFLLFGCDDPAYDPSHLS